MIILGIDPGTAMTGFGVIKWEKEKAIWLAHGTIKTTNEDDSGRRLDLIFCQISDLIKKHRPKVLALESLFFNTNAKSASAVGQAIGVVKLAAERAGIKSQEYTPLSVKMKLLGKGRAEKKEMQAGVKKLLKLKDTPRPTHAADALAVAICHHKTCLLKS